MSTATAPEGETKNATTPEGEEERRSVISSDLATNLLTRNEDVFRQIFSFHDVLKIRDLIDLRFLIDLRSSCKLFRLSLPPPPLYTVFPHFKHASLESLLNRLSARRAVLGRVAYKSRVRRLLRTQRAQQVAAAFASNLRTVAARVIKQKGAAVRG